MRRLTVLHDPHCPLCVALSDWLVRQPHLVPLDTVALGSPQALSRFPTLDERSAGAEVTVVADTGAVWSGPAAFVMCLWATRAGRATAEWLARGDNLRLARAMAHAAAGLRGALASPAPDPAPAAYPRTQARSPGSVTHGPGYRDARDPTCPGGTCGAEIR